MYIDENTLSGVLNNFGNLNKGRIKKRFDEVEQFFGEIGNIVCEDFKSFGKVEKWEDGEIKKFNEQDDGKIFAPCHIGLTDDKRYGGILLQKKYFEHSNYDNKIKKGQNYLSSEGRGELVVDILSIIGGFDSRGKMKDEYRILSNAQTSKDDFNSTLQSNGQYAWINSHFADNTLFCEFVDFVKKCKKSNGNNEVKSEWYENIALCYPYADNEKTIGKLSNSEGDDIEQIEGSKQQDILAYRFPLKFLWMWANKDKVIHPLSLMAFREFLKSEFTSEIFKDLSKKNFSGLNYDDSKKMGTDFSKYAEQITNAKIEYFPKIWGEVSKAIMDKLQEVCEKKQSIKEVSQLISLLTLGETDMTNIDELLKTHKQIILYGVPGTGKTHSAKELIKKWGKEAFQVTQEESKKEDDLKKWQFSEITNPTNTQKDKKQETPIVWDIMQFHPNTTYQDFIGGIIPKTEKNKSLTYEVESGKFKRFCEYASANKDKKFIFIIDEINRANLSEVLGELLYALEYRDEGITIPNFNEPFVIPSNVYIIGTMNNVDKSLATFDLALRRRFGFYEIKPDLDVLNEMLSFEKEQENDIQVKSEDKEEDNSKPLIADLEEYIVRCKNLNKKIIEKLSDKNSQIGQAYFKKIEDFLKKEEENQIVTPFHLQKLWDYHLEPLLQEYVGFVDNGENKIEDLKKAWLGKVEE